MHVNLRDQIICLAILLAAIAICLAMLWHTQYNVRQTLGIHCTPAQRTALEGPVRTSIMYAEALKFTPDCDD